MSAIINALFGTYSPPPEEEQTVPEQSITRIESVRTSAVADNVQVKSQISSETQAKATINTKLNIDNLLTQLSTTHTQVDEYSRTRVAEINEQTQKSIADVLANTQDQQGKLLAIANQRHLIIENEYKIQLKKAIEALDAVKAKTLADLERDLQSKQQLILSEAKKQIDILNDQANVAKLNALVEAQLQNKVNIDNLTDQVAAIGQQETQNLLQSTTTTIITSHAQSTGSTEITGSTTNDEIVTGRSNLSTRSITPVAVAANVALNSDAIESIVSNARARGQNKTAESVTTAPNVTVNNNAIGTIVPKTAATSNTISIDSIANVALNSNVIECIVNNAREKSKNKSIGSTASTNN